MMKHYSDLVEAFQDAGEPLFRKFKNNWMPGDEGLPEFFPDNERLKEVQGKFHKLLDNLYIDKYNFVNRLSIPENRNWREVVVPIFEPSSPALPSFDTPVIKTARLESYTVEIEMLVNMRGQLHGNKSYIVDSPIVIEQLEYAMHYDVDRFIAYIKEKLNANSVGESASGSSESSGEVRS